jgi:dTDP-4-dehydrorhamnose 3,5-epimerase
MRFVETPLKDAYLVELEPIGDHRGFFARAFCQQEFEEHGLSPVVAQCNISTNTRQGTLRGMHYQLPPATETKLVRCTRGAIYDVIIDMRPGSPTYLQQFGVELTDENRQALYVPGMFAHGYQALTEESEIFYMVSEFYAPGQERGLRHDDPYFGIEWPLPVAELSDKDGKWPLFDPERAEEWS